ncbi:bacteriohemerythrin [Flammeovirgaceae bacterium SG7u.111]|nr:bacteriohemerythrin [Flammeovirgaceae bacterium SG7u.132]WPO35960.1 bacteriohemerythrin [Flammeovirgaceae bacterium SG7u.111]
MATITWNKKSHSVGIQKIDDQHKQLFLIVEELDQAIRAGRGERVLQNIIDKLFAYSSYHFSTEERIFRQFGQKEIQKYQEAHEEFQQWLMQVKEELEIGDKDVAIAVFNFLNHWLQNHVVGRDKSYYSRLAESKTMAEEK